MLDRLMGTETEYAIRFVPAPGAAHPGHEALFDHLTEAVRELVHVGRADGSSGEDMRSFFTENGGAFNFEQNDLFAGGLFEAGTPECRGPAQLLLYQRAQDRLLERAVAIGQGRMSGEDGELGLLKNCRDAVGNIYGAQENYEVDIARGPRLWLWRLGLVVVAPLALACGLLIWAVSFVVILFAALFVIGLGTVRALGGDEVIDFEAWSPRFLGIAVKIITVLFAPPVRLTLLLVDLVAFRPYRRQALGFLASRPILSGAGTLDADGTWSLSEKMGSVKGVLRRSVATHDRGILETGHLVKPVQGFGLLLQWRRLRSLFRARQRLQIGMSDANRCDVAEYLKLGTTALVLDMVEAGVLTDAPRPRRPADAARTLAGDPSLTVEVTLRGGTTATALQLQRFYCERATRFVEETAAPVEAHQLVRLWSETLDALEADRSQLVGRLDWVTKRALAERAGSTNPDAIKVIDLRYHELGPDSYFAWLANAGIVVGLVEDADIDQAMRTPPVDTPARQRGQIVKALSETGTEARVGWDKVRVPGRKHGRIIWLDEHRSRGRPTPDGNSSELP